MSVVTHQQVIELVKTLPAERLTSLYDYARFLRENPPLFDDEGDIFGETPDGITADEAWWNNQFESDQEVLLRLAEEAMEEDQADRTASMTFDEQGRLRR